MLQQSGGGKQAVPFVAQEESDPTAEPQTTEDRGLTNRECHEEDRRGADDVGAPQGQMLTAMCFHRPW